MLTSLSLSHTRDSTQPPLNGGLSGKPLLITSLDQHNRIHFDMVEEQSTRTREVVSEDRAIFSD